MRGKDHVVEEARCGLVLASANQRVSTGKTAISDVLAAPLTGAFLEHDLLAQSWSVTNHLPMVSLSVSCSL